MYHTEKPPKLEPVAGGINEVNIEKLSETEKKAMEFVKKNVDLEGWKLDSVKTQIVAGQNICFTYEKNDSEETQEYCVWSKPWDNNFMELTLADGTKITQGGSNNLQTNN